MPDQPAADALYDLNAEIRLWEGDGSSPADLAVLRNAAAEITRLRAEVADLRELRAVATAALRCALAPEADRVAREAFTEVALAHLAGYGGDWDALQAAERGRTRGH